MFHDEEFLFKGSAGRLQGRLFESNDVSKPSALILHPNPRMGGTMNNSIIHTVYKALINLDISVLRLNFRSVDKSEGVFDYGKGEVTDSAKALDFLIEKCYSTSCVIVAVLCWFCIIPVKAEDAAACSFLELLGAARRCSESRVARSCSQLLGFQISG